jgi:hypothetical protein
MTDNNIATARARASRANGRLGGRPADLARLADALVQKTRVALSRARLTEQQLQAAIADLREALALLEREVHAREQREAP